MRLVEVGGPDRRVVDAVAVRLGDLVVAAGRARRRGDDADRAPWCGVGLGSAELAEEREDLVFALERELDVLALGDLDHLVLAGGRGLALEDHVPGLLLEGGLLGGPRAGKVVGLVALVVGIAVGIGGTHGAGQPTANVIAVTTTATFLSLNA